MSRKTTGLFMKTIDWSDPKFSPWDLANVDLNSAQRNALLSEDIDVSKNNYKYQEVIVCRMLMIQ